MPADQHSEFHESWDPAGERERLRSVPRLPQDVVETISLRLEGHGASPGAWVAADVLDISLEGMALVIGTALPLALDQLVLLDFGNHPEVDLVNVRARVRWFVPSPLVMTLGVQFEHPLERLPTLAQSRT